MGRTTAEKVVGKSARDGASKIASQRLSVLQPAAALPVLAVVASFTAFKERFLPFRLCPFVLATAAALILAGTP